LKSLTVYGTSVNDLTPLAGLTNLVYLRVSGTSVKDLTPLAGLKHLVTLNLADTSVCELTPLAGLNELTSLNVRGTPVSSEQLDSLRKQLPNCQVKGPRQYPWTPPNRPPASGAGGEFPVLIPSGL